MILRTYTKRFKAANKKSPKEGTRDLDALYREFGTQLANFVIRRKHESYWLGLRILNFDPPAFERARIAFPDRYREATEGLLLAQPIELDVDLKRRQKKWTELDEGQHMYCGLGRDNGSVSDRERHPGEWKTFLKLPQDVRKAFCQWVNPSTGDLRSNTGSVTGNWRFESPQR